MRYRLIPLLLLLATAVSAQELLTPEMLWSLKRVNPEAVSNDGRYLYYTSRQVDWKTEKSTYVHYRVNIADGKKTETNSDKTVIQRNGNVLFANDDNVLYKSTNEGKTWKSVFTGLDGADNIWVSPDGRHVAFSKDVLVKPNLGKDIYSDLPKTTAQVYTDLNDRHWDTWEDGKYSHIFVADIATGSIKDIMATEPFDCPQKPSGGAEDLTWSPDSKGLVYVCKKKYGKEYAQSTNTDLYYYNIYTGNTENWTEGMMGYDTNPVFSKDGNYIAWLSMKRDGYEADKNDIIVMKLSGSKKKMNLTAKWDETAGGVMWSNSGNKIYFNAAWRGTEQLFEVNVPIGEKESPKVNMITEGKFDVNGMVGQAGNELVVTRSDMNHATEIFAVNLSDGDMRPLSKENNAAYRNIKQSKTELRKITTADGKKMGVWVIYPPDFDPKKKYPTLLYCQGGPQSALSQFYSIRWNFQLMAANGYIIVAPNRRGMPGWGVKWNEDISGDWGGAPMQDYLDAIDNVSKESYVDKDRLGCVGASYGGYSVYMLAGIHNNRFKTFIAHDGLFDLKSWYGTTEELWFANYDIGGPYWKNPTPEAYSKFNPSNYVDKWNTPIMIVQGGIDFRVPVEQGLEAFQAAQLKGIKSKLLYLPNENHWVLHAQNGIAWQREFFSWLSETLK